MDWDALVKGAVSALLFGMLVTAAVPVSASDERSRSDYLIHCTGCHAHDGSGHVGRVPALRNQVGHFLNVAGGREFLVRIPGVAQSPLNNERTAAVLNWILREFGGDSTAQGFKPYNAAEIARHRDDPLLDPAAERARLLATLGQ